jgi:hypothetical protein
LDSAFTGSIEGSKAIFRDRGFSVKLGRAMEIALGQRNYERGKIGPKRTETTPAQAIGEGGRAPERDGVMPNTSGNITVNEILEGYLNHADSYYVKNGVPTSQPTQIRHAN